MTTARRFQFVWWWRPRFGIERYYDCGMSRIYRWALLLGFLEIRRWAR